MMTPRCLGCGYPLVGVKRARCPECGRGFDARDPETWAAGVVSGRVKRWLQGPVGMVDWGLIVLGAGMLCYAWSVPGVREGWMVAGTMVWMAAGALWLLRVGERLTASRDREARAEASEWFWMRAATAPAMMLVCIAVMRADLPLRVCFQMAKPGLNKAVGLRGAMPMNRAYWVDAWPYELRRSLMFPQELVAFEVEGDSRRRKCAFLYVPDELVDRVAQYERWYDWRRLEGNWFVVRGKWE